jgi:serine/threonine protein kinase
MERPSRYTFAEKIGEGGFGKIHLVHDKLLKRNLALKQEPKKVEHESEKQLRHEFEIYNRLGSLQGIPKIYDYDERSDPNYRTMSMQLLGSNLEDMFEKCGRQFSLKTILMIADRLLATIESVHSKGVIHKDIKPENIVCGYNSKTVKSSSLYVVDFGLSAVYMIQKGDSNIESHIEWEQRDISIDGTARYASINAHFGISQSRRDDLEAIAYVLIYLQKGRLPWQGIKDPNRYNKICSRKMQLTTEELCQGLHPSFRTFFDMCRLLGFDDLPPYSSMRKLFREAAREHKITYDDQYDWLLFPSQLLLRKKNENMVNNRSIVCTSVKGAISKKIQNWIN